MRVNELWQLNFSLIDGKNGWTRSNVLGGEFNYTSRSVIVLDPTLKMNEVDMPYKSFLVMFGGLIIKKLVKQFGWTITKANNYLKSKFAFDQHIYELMQEIVRERDVSIILNRNPEYVGF